MKGIILAGGSGILLYPLTKATFTNEKLMMYYLLSVLMIAGINKYSTLFLVLSSFQTHFFLNN
jgi:dTDP-glucose pyrophosphorylase